MANEGQFVTGSSLSKHIRLVAAGNNTRCAVAFWGAKAADEIFASADAAERAVIICDISMGATSAKALEALGAPENPNLLFLDGLHAKVYHSDAGVVICSANASSRGVGFGGAEQGRLIEAGTFHGPKSVVHRRASAWLSGIFEHAMQVDKAALARANDLYRPPRPAVPKTAASSSLIGSVCANPDGFDGIGFVFTTIASSADEVKSAKQRAKKSIAPAEVEGWPRGGAFLGWGKSEVRVWPTLFLEFWCPRDKLSVFPRRLVHKDENSGDVFSRSAVREISAITQSTIVPFKGDVRIVKNIIDLDETYFFRTARDLRDYVVRHRLMD